MANIKYVDENGVRKIITLTKDMGKSKIEAERVSALPTTGVAKGKMYLIETDNTDENGVKLYEAYMYVGLPQGWIKLSGEPSADTQTISDDFIDSLFD